MKKIIVVLLILVTLLSVVGCSSEKGAEAEDEKFLVKPDGCELDFWICENVKDVDFSEYTEIIGISGGKEYAGKGYEVTRDAEDQTAPDQCVLYTLTAWPDYADFEETGYHVTKITVTDPEVSVFGVNTASSRVEFRKLMTEAGFIIDDPIGDGDGFIEVASTPGGTYSIHFTASENGGTIQIIAPVENREGIVF